jgi:hypothetical protein
MTAAASVAAYGSRFLKRTMKRYGQAKAIVIDRLPPGGGRFCSVLAGARAKARLRKPST